MNTEAREVEEGTLIKVETDDKIALAIRSGKEETIYLPTEADSDSSYYVEATSSLIKTQEGYKVIHEEEIDGIELIKSS